MPATLNMGCVFTFLDGLSQHNNKTWFEKHRQDYETARETFEQFIEDLIEKLRTSDQLGDLTAKECVSRINRDIRFSKDKSPYKTNFSAMVAPGGRKGDHRGYYIAIGPNEQSHIGGGLCMSTPEQLTCFRKAIDKNATAFKKITQSKSFKETFGELEGERLKTAPQGYDKEHPEIALLQLKQVMATHRFSDEDVLANNFMTQAVKVCRSLKPFLDYLNEVLK